MQVCIETIVTGRKSTAVFCADTLRIHRVDRHQKTLAVSERGFEQLESLLCFGQVSLASLVQHYVTIEDLGGMEPLGQLLGRDALHLLHTLSQFVGGLHDLGICAG